ncbi:MAG: ketopantoate reductase family protein [Christensenellales bacterium]
MTKIKTVGIVGAGALGVMYGNTLTQGLGRDNVFFIADAKRISRYQREGIYCNDQLCDFNYANPNTASVDFLIFATKFNDLHDAVKLAQPFVHTHTILISVLNGIESEHVLAARLGEDHLLYCVVHGMDATKEANRVSYTRMGSVVFGDRLNVHTADVHAVSDLFDRVGIDYLVPEDIIHRLWSKLMLNTGVNQVAAVYDLGYGGLQQLGEIRRMMIDAMQEVRLLAAKEGIAIQSHEIEEWLTIVDSLAPDNMPSMVQDIRAKRKTEVELFSGTVRKLAQKHGIETPVNDFLYAEIQKLESGF